MGRKFAARGCAAVMLGMVAGQAMGVSIDWKNPGAWVASGVERVEPVAVLRAAKATPTASRVIVRLARTPTAAERASLKNAGLALLAPLGGGTFFAHVDAGADADALALRVVEATGVRREHKLHPDLAVATPPAWSVLATPTPWWRPTWCCTRMWTRWIRR
jgi:hypothetical protein